MRSADSQLLELARELGTTLHRRGWSLVTAESCTGGWIAKVVTDVSGSSDWLDRGFVTYSNEAKREMLGVSPTTLEKYGAVSAEVVEEMVRGALAHSSAHMGVAVSGVAGPTGGTRQKPVGLVYCGWRVRGENALVREWHFSGDRDAVRRLTVVAALEGALGVLASG